MSATLCAHVVNPAPTLDYHPPPRPHDPAARRKSSSAESSRRQHSVSRRRTHVLRRMARHIGLPHSSHRTLEQQQDAREARRLLKERVREDWDYPVLPAHRASNSGRKVQTTSGGFKVHDTNGTPELEKIARGLDNQPVEWRARRYSTGSDSDPGSASVKETFRFENPDTLGEEIDDRKQERKRRKNQALEEEMQWNDGLAHWIDRRNIWSGALNSQNEQPDRSRESVNPASLGEVTDTVASESSRTSTSSALSSTTDHGSDLTAAANTSSAATTPDPSIAEIGASPASKHAHSPDILIPVTPRILPDHPVRKSISPSMYSEIYTKIIVQGRTPSVPINLYNVISALVQGWKDDGEWPPRPGVVEASIGKKKKSSQGSESTLKSSVKAVGRVLRLTGVGESSIAK